MSRFLKRTWAEVDLDAIAHNYKAIRSYIREGCKIMAVVKADAYGHGAPLAAQELQTLGADYFGVSNIEEAMQIRRSGITKPILILGFTPVNYARNLIDEQITQTVFSYEYGRELSNAAREAGGKIRAHIKMDTGMSRIGFVVEDEPAPDVIGRIEKTVALPGLEFEGVFTHFAVADEPENNFTQTQFERFTRALDALEAKGVTFSIRHCCNSAGLMNYPEMQMDMVRPGIILYGLTPAEGMPMALELKPAMTLKAAISQVKRLPKHVAVSYGMKYVTTGETAVATLPIGYADGYPRSLSNSADVLICGKRARIVGRVCMDQCMADVSEIPEITGQSTAVIIGRDGDEQITMEEIASKMGTVNYETVCLIGKRVPRVFYKNGEFKGLQDYIL